MIHLLGNALLILGVILIFFGSFCILLFSQFYSRLLSCTYIDTMGMIAVLLGLLLRYWNQTQGLKLFLLIVIILLINPVSSYAIGRAAYTRGERPKKEESSHG